MNEGPFLLLLLLSFLPLFAIFKTSFNCGEKNEEEREEEEEEEEL